MKQLAVLLGLIVIGPQLRSVTRALRIAGHLSVVFRSTHSHRAVPGESAHDRQAQYRPVTPEHRAGLRLVAEGLPAGTAVPVVREQLLTLLQSEPTETPDAPETRLLTAEEVAKRLPVDVQTVRRRQKQLGAVKVGRAVRFSEQGVQRYLARRALS